jgi:small-conductance mechanosensitive channel
MLFSLITQQAPESTTWEVWKFHAWGPWLSVRLMHTALYLAGAFILNRLWRMVLKRIQAAAEDDDPTTKNDLEQRVETVTAILRRLGTAVVYTAATLIILNDFGVQIGPLLAGLGIAGVALGFGAQYLVRDVITGFFVVLEDQFRVGDIIKIKDVSGVVEHMYLRTTQIRSPNGDLSIIPNGEITQVTNMTRSWSRAVIDIGVSYGADLDEVFEALREAGRRAHSDPEIGPAFMEVPDVLGVMGFGDSAINVRMWAKVAPPSRQWEVERFLRKKLKEVFDERGLEIPFPQRTLSLDPAATAILQDLKKKPS